MFIVTVKIYLVMALWVANSADEVCICIVHCKYTENLLTFCCQNIGMFSKTNKK